LLYISGNTKERRKEKKERNKERMKERKKERRGGDNYFSTMF
jgi:hypothetical protein